MERTNRLLNFQDLQELETAVNNDMNLKFPNTRVNFDQKRTSELGEIATKKFQEGIVDELQKLLMLEKDNLS